MQALQRTLAALALAGLAGCAGPVDLGPLFNDGEAYSRQRFSQQAVMPPAAALTPAGRNALPFERLTLTGEMRSVRSGSKDAPDLSRFETTYIRDGDGGNVRMIERHDINGLPATAGYALQSHGLVNLAFQTGSVAQRQAIPIQYVLSASQWDPLDGVREGQRYRYVMRLGSRSPLDVTYEMQIDCKVLAAQAASETIPAATGRAFPMACSYTNDNGVKSREASYLWLEQQGLAVLRQLRLPSKQIDFFYHSLEQQ
ncbi:hypothetical protein [Bordetella trematum]|uniref:hypothetical protein n=1 Tax=Bordetella trematum TaxID=123899 RepID=UPI000470D374|nr:hypothetical protein [Bordetella trematum]QIM71582.1 hypothetical protein EYB34_09445 [Bordetella trematum]